MTIKHYTEDFKANAVRMLKEVDHLSMIIDVSMDDFLTWLQYQLANN